MLEDFVMEKKPSIRSAQAPGKGSSAEGKKGQDVASSKPYPRSRRREPTGSNCSKNEPNRKLFSQKTKTLDKRPRPRGQCYNGGKEDTKVAEGDGAEYGSVFVPGSKKQNLNHLLNFHYAPREVVSSSWNWRHGTAGRHGMARWLSTHKHKYNKEQFLQANCQFVVKADGDYTQYLSNPDTLVNWDFIEQIHLQSSELLSCPICLYPPVAAKMTRCGHVFCWPCVLHYLALSDKAWRKCPICYEAVHKQDLKSVVAMPHTQFSVGEEVTLRLMKRDRGSLVAMPVAQSGIRPAEQPLSMSETLVDTVYSKLLLAMPYEVMSIVDRERRELLVQLSEDEAAPEKCFIEQAIAFLGEREVPLFNGMDKLTTTTPVATVLAGSTATPVAGTTGTTATPVAGTTAMQKQEHQLENESGVVKQAIPATQLGTTFLQKQDCQPTMVGDEPDEVEDSFADFGPAVLGSDCCDRQRYESQSSEGSQPIGMEDLEVLPLALTNKSFYFYQASDGQHVFLHTINVRMLEHEYGSLELCPPVVRGRIVEKESSSVTEDMRRRLRYLQHLPVTCQFELAELDLRPPLVQRATLQHFQEQLELRRRRRQKRAREEKRREKKINEEEGRRWGHFPTPHIRIESHYHFPQYSPETEITGITLSGSPSVSSLDSVDSISLVAMTTEVLTLDDIAESNVGSSDSNGRSFAQMLREGTSHGGRSEWHSKTELQKAKVQSDSEPEQEGYIPAPSYSLSVSDAIAMALEKKEEAQGEGAGGGGRKKKKQKQKVLFATSMACSGK